MVKKSVPKKKKSATKKSAPVPEKIRKKTRYTVRDLPGKTPTTFPQFVNKSQQYNTELNAHLKPGEFFGFDIYGKQTRHFSDDFAAGVEGIVGSWSLSRRGLAEDLIDNVVIVKFHDLKARRSQYKEQRRKGLAKAEKEKQRRMKDVKKISDQEAQLKKLRAQLRAYKKKEAKPKRRKI